MATPILAEAQHYPVANLSGLAEVLRHQAGVMNEVADVGNADLPGHIANGSANVMIWVAAQLDKAQESLEREAVQNAQPKPSLSAVM